MTSTILILRSLTTVYDRVIRWHLLLEEFGPHIHHIAGVNNIVADTLSRVKSSNVREDKNESSEKRMLQELYAATKIQSIRAEFPLEKGLICDKQQKELNKRRSILKTLIEDKNSGYTTSNINDVKLVLKDNKIYIPESMREAMLNWYHHYLNHPGGDRLANTIKQNCYWKRLSNQAKKNMQDLPTIQEKAKVWTCTR